MLWSGPAQILLGASHPCPAGAPVSEALGVDGSALGFMILGGGMQLVMPSHGGSLAQGDSLARQLAGQ